MADEFTCAGCGGTFTKAWTDDEANAEAAEVFGAIPDDMQVEVCDDCYVGLYDTAHERGVDHVFGNAGAAERAAEAARQTIRGRS